MLSIEDIESLEYSTTMTKCKGCTNNCRLTINHFSGGRKFITGNRCERGLGKEKASNTLPNLFDYKFHRYFDYTPLKEEEATKEFATLFENMTSVLSGKVKAVRASRRLKSHPVCLANEGDLSIEMEKVLNSMPNGQQVKADKVLEVNVNHDVFKSLQAAYEHDQEKFDLFTDVLYNQARLIEGLDIEDPVAFTNNVCRLMK